MSNQRAEQYLKRAIRLARQGSLRGEGGPFGALIVHQDQVIAESWNRVLSACDPTAHAEICAIRLASRQLARFHLEDCVLYTSSEPCPMCLAAAYWARISRIVFANTRAEAAAIGFCDAELYDELALDYAARKLEMVHLPIPESAAFMHDWSQMSGRQLY